MDDLDDELMKAVSATAKIVGGDVKNVPAPQAEVQTSMKSATKALSDLNKARNDMLKEIQTYENSLDKLRNDLIAYRHKLPKEKFGLDDKKPDDEKKIEAARKILDDGLQEVLDELIESETKIKPVDSELQQEIK
jgi:hypothetical protein